MADSGPQRRLLRFEDFEVDLRSGELRKAGVKLKLTGQPFHVLAILLERPGEIVTRDELQKRLWPDTFVDVERNLNTAINKIREVLGDSAESPRFIETLPRRGYRFVLPVEADGNSVQASEFQNERATKDTRTFTETGRRRVLSSILVSFAICALLASVGWLIYQRMGPGAPTSPIPASPNPAYFR